MEIVNRYTFKINTVTSATTLNIPISLEAYPVDQAELIESQFVDNELAKSVNPIVDYESARFTPSDYNNIPISTIIYKLTLLTGDKYSDAGFSNSDFTYRRNVLKKSFLRLDFYDSPKLTSQNFLFSSTIYCRVLNDMFLTSNIKDTTTIPLQFKLEDPISNPSGVSEGFYLYDYKEDISLNAPKDVYMRATFNNAKDGKTYGFMITNTSQAINDLVNNIHTKYTLKLDNNGNYHYQLENDNHIIINNGIATINLYEIKVL
jgi:hypothetical protein